MNSSWTKKTAMDPDPKATGLLADHIEALGLEPAPLPAEFYYPSLPLCVIDAVFSIGVTHVSTRNTVVRICENLGWNIGPLADRTNGEKTIASLLECFSGLSPDEAAETLFGNRQRTSSRSGILKADAVRRFAKALVESGINDFLDITEERLATASLAIRQIPGQSSGISFDYFRMLAGDDSLIKPDRMVQRYIAKVLGTKPGQIGAELAKELLQSVVKELNKRGHAWSPRGLDYVIWQRTSGGGNDMAPRH